MPKKPFESKDSLRNAALSKPTTRSLDKDDPEGIRARLRQLGVDTEAGNKEAQDELLATALRYYEEIDVETETSPIGIVSSFLCKPIRRLLADEKAKLAVFDVTRKRGRPESSKTDRLYQHIAMEIGRSKAAGSTTAEALDKAAGILRDVKTVERAYKKHRAVADAVEMVEKYHKNKK